jgi:diguanylate cyclase (GGDEF)-like protein
MDLFEDEQQVYNNAMAHVAAVREGTSHSLEEFETLVKEYGRLLKQLRRVTKFADKTTTDLHTSNLDLVDKVHYDALTGIYNRRFMEENLKQLIKSLSRSGGVLSIMVLDVDFFKKYNDTYGHSEGDACLKSVAETLSRAVTREGDFVARYGGEEFVVVLPHTDESGAHVTANRLLENMIECGIPHEKNEAADCVTISIGGTTTMVKHTHDGCDYIKRADEALYMSKQNGRNRYTHLKFEEAVE